MTRITLYLLLPLSVIYALFLIASGVPQTLAGSVDVFTLEGEADPRPWSCGVSGSDQDAGHQRRRFLQRQFSPSV
jgi:hypothetical protein